ncbi:Pantothenate transporter liz1 [Meyerozyma sp. JA9]|nr:Pantothenate transporter liz1 [Meyerozyma sp. JA9]
MPSAKGNSCSYSEQKPIDEPYKPSRWDRICNFDSNDREDKILALKIDLFVLTYVCLSCFIKNLDQTNVRNAYVSGLGTDLKFNGTQYNYVSTWWLIGYIVGSLPWQIVLCYVRPSLLLPGLELAWSIVTIATCKVKSVHAFYGLRFLIGFFEAGSYPAIITLLGNWYTSSLGFKVTLMQVAASLAQMFSGYLQAALLANMNNKSGLAAWRWLFIFDGIVTIPVVIYGLLVIPDTPDNSRAFWLSPTDKEKCRERMKLANRTCSVKLGRHTFKNVFSSWPVYLFTAVFVFHEISINLATYLNLWLKSIPKYKEDVRLLNIIPTAAYALHIVVMTAFSVSSDMTGKRLPFAVAYASLGSIGSLILVICQKNEMHNTNAQFAGWFILSTEMGFISLVSAWLSEITGYSAGHRTLVLGVTQAVGYAAQASVPLLIYPANEAPYYRIGYQCALGFFIAEAALCYTIWATYALEKKGKIRFMGIKEDVS